MSCAGVAPLLSGLLDGELDADEAAWVAEHLDGCGACRELLDSLEGVVNLAAEAVPEPEPEAWRAFEAELRVGLAREVTPAAPWERRRGWAATLAAAAAALLVGVGLARALVAPRVVLAGGRLPNPSLVHREPAWRASPPSAVPPLSEVEGSEEALATVGGLGSAVAALEAHGLVQLPTRARSLAELYPAPGGLPPGDARPAPLATADASLLLYGAAASRAALVVERELVVPGVRDLLALLARELSQLEGLAGSGEVRAAARRVRGLIGVAAVLEGVDPRLTGELAAAVEAEAALVAAAEAEARSPLTGATVDYRAFRPRGIYGELARHAAAMRWLSLRGLALGSEEDTRAACLLALALARGRLPDGRPGLAGQARLEAAIEVLYGPPDALTPFDVLDGLRQGLGRATLRLEDLTAPGAMEAVAARAARAAEVRGAHAVRPGGPPVCHLLGRTRSLEGLVFTRLTAPALPERGLPSSLDLLALLGSRRARAGVSALGGDVPGYDQALEELRPLARAWSDATLPVPVRTGLEQARLWSVAPLAAPRAPDGAPFQSGPRYRSRLLLAALAGLNAPLPAPAGPPSAPSAAGPLPLVEPLPRLHARLAFSARRLSAALGQLLGDPAEPSPAVVALRALLERVATLEEALRDASLDVLEGRRPAPETTQVLRGYVATLRDLGPPHPFSAEDAFEAPEALLHRIVFRLDRLVVVALDPWSRRPRLAVGAALAACDLPTAGRRLTPSEAAHHPAARTPAWADHVLESD